MEIRAARFDFWWNPATNRHHIFADASPVNCPLCNQKMPFGLQIHLAAAHGSAQVKQQLRSAEEGNAASARSIQRQHARTRPGQPFASKPRKRPNYLARARDLNSAGFKSM